MKKFAIVTCVTPNWLTPAAVTLLSCAQHGAEEFADLIIVSFDTVKAHQNKLKLFNLKHQTNIQLLDVSLSDFKGMGNGLLGVGAIMRLKLDQFMPKAYERVLYLDSDVLAESNCHEIFELDLQNKPFGAVESTAMLPWINKKAAAHLQSIDMDKTAPYFNSGVMVFDWKKTLRCSFLSRSFELLKQNPSWLFPDQDAMNSSNNNEWVMLDHKYNVTKKTADYVNIKPVFRHFNGTSKPWNSKYRFGFARYHKFYFESLEGTPWQDFMDQPQNPWPIKDNWRAILRKLSFRKIAKLKHHISLVMERA